MRLQLLTLLFGLACLQLFAQGTQNLELAIYFETASAELSADSKAALQEISTQINGMGDYRLELTAHTDSRGSNRYNDRLAESRVESVATFLKNQGITTDNLQTLALGESRAGNDTDNESLQQENRRVDVLVEGWYWQGMGSLQDSLASPLVQNFSVSADEDLLLDGQKGGRFFISANSFVDLDGNEVNGPVDIQLTECYSMGDMISLGLTTTAQERILESGGMLRITASANGQPLQLKDGRSIAAAVPTPSYQEDMSLFYGQAHGEEQDQLDWVDTEAPVQSQLPRLRLAPAPQRPIWTMYGRTFLQYFDFTNDPRRPKEPSMRKPIRPREPNYDRVVYRRKGLEKIFMGKNTLEEKTADVREQRRERHEENIRKYEERMAEYTRQWEKYNADSEAYKILVASEVDAGGFLIGGPNYEANKAKADAAYEQAITQYRVDSMRYEKYRAYKMGEYEKQLEALGSVDASSLSTYFLNINRMGWANIDRFLKETPTTRLLAQEESDSPDSQAMVFLMIPERNIILRMPYQQDAGFMLRRVPLGEKAKVLALKIKDQKAFIASQEIIITDDLVLALNYQPGRLRDIRAELDAI